MKCTIRNTTWYRFSNCDCNLPCTFLNMLLN